MWRRHAGPATFTLTNQKVSENDSDVNVMMDAAEKLPRPVILLLDPALQGRLEIGQIKVPTPLPTSVALEFSDCQGW